MVASIERMRSKRVARTKLECSEGDLTMFQDGSSSRLELRDITHPVLIDDQVFKGEQNRPDCSQPGKGCKANQAMEHMFRGRTLVAQGTSSRRYWLQPGKLGAAWAVIPVTPCPPSHASKLGLRMSRISSSMMLIS